MTMLAKPLYPIPRRTSTVAMWFFLAALTMLFGSSMIGYFFIRETGTNAPAGTSLHLPRLLWLSTLVIILASMTISLALSALRHERQDAFRRNITLTLILAGAFVAIQAPALSELLHTHFQMQQVGVRMYGMLFFLILLHALHVVGGIIMLVIVTWGAYRGRYDHEHYLPVRNATLYWHFLDGVWIVMFLSLTAVG